MRATPEPAARSRMPQKLASIIVIAAWSHPALADTDPVSGVDFVTVGAVGNAAWPGDGTIPPEFDRAIGRGAVNYEY